MRKRRVAGWAALLMAVLLCALPLCVGAEDVPASVLDARDGVVRVVAIVPEGYGTGSGFAVGMEDEIYIVTNHHVVDLSDYTSSTPEIRIYYNTGRFVNAEIVKEAPERDLCILRPTRDIPGLEILPLQRDDVEVGSAVYALGFPAAADLISGGVEQSVDEIASDKAAITLTNGVVSAVRNAGIVGDASRSVKTVQTNTSISNGNSGGPLLDKNGNVVGINTFTMVDDRNIAGAVHVEELVAVLKSARIDFLEADDLQQGGTPEVQNTGTSVWLIVALVGAGVVVVAVVVVLLLRRGKRPALKGGENLTQFEQGNRRIEDEATLQMAKGFVESLLPLAGYDLNPLMRPDNIIIGTGAVTLREQGSNEAPGTAPKVYSGYSAPEVYSYRAGTAATVYFVGTVMYTINTGHRPPDAQHRLAQPAPLFAGNQPLHRVINQATEPAEHNRIQTLQQLWQALAQAEAEMHAAGQLPPGGGQPWR